MMQSNMVAQVPYIFFAAIVQAQQFFNITVINCIHYYEIHSV